MVIDDPAFVAAHHREALEQGRRHPQDGIALSGGHLILAGVEITHAFDADRP